MTFLRFSVPQRRNSLFAPKRPYQSLLSIRNPNLLPKLEKNTIEKDNTSKKDESCNIGSRCKTKTYNGELLVDNDNPKPLVFCSHKDILKGEINISTLPPLPCPNHPTFDNIFREKIKICNYIFNFIQPQIQLKGKMEKTKALNEIFALLCKTSDTSLLTDENKNSILDMITKNIFEQNPFVSSKTISSLTIKLTFSESSWDHLYTVFKILNQFVLIFPEKFQLSHVKKAIRLMNIPDTNERECLVTFLKNYTKFHQNQFDDIWKELKCALENVRYDIYTIYCIDPIISYMSIQLLSNTSTFCNQYLSKILMTHLLPLLLNEKLPLYFNKLINLIIQIADKNFNVRIHVIQFLLKHFPIQCGQKQPLFVSALISMTNSMSSEELDPVANKILTFIAISVKSPNCKLAESALSFLMKPNLKPIIYSNYELAMEILYEPLKWSSSFYWEKYVKDQSSIALSTLMNARLEFQKSQSLSEFVLNGDSNQENQMSKKTDINDLSKTWASLSRMAAKRDRSFDLTKSLYNIQIFFSKERMNLDKKSSNEISPITNKGNKSNSNLSQSRKNYLKNSL